MAAIHLVLYRLLLLSMLVSSGCCSYMSDHRRLLDYLLRSNEGLHQNKLIILVKIYILKT